MTYLPLWTHLFVWTAFRCLTVACLFEWFSQILSSSFYLLCLSDCIWVHILLLCTHIHDITHTVTCMQCCRKILQEGFDSSLSQNTYWHRLALPNRQSGNTSGRCFYIKSSVIVQDKSDQTQPYSWVLSLVIVNVSVNCYAAL